MDVDDQILDVKFSFCEYDYDEPVYCPYFQTSKLSIKLDGDKEHSERYFTEYITSKSNPELPFYRKVNMFLCDVTIKECLMYFLRNCKTKIGTLLLDYQTLENAVKESKKLGDDLFSPSLATNLKCIKLCNSVMIRDNLSQVIDYLISNLSLESFWIGIDSKSTAPDLNSFIVYNLLSKQYGIKGIQISKDEGFRVNELYRAQAKDVIMEVAHHTTSGYWKQLIIVEEAKISTNKVFMKKGNESICFLTPIKFKFTGIRFYDELKDKKYANYASVLKKAGEGPNLVNGEYFIKMFVEDTKKLFESDDYFSHWVKEK